MILTDGQTSILGTSWVEFWNLLKHYDGDDIDDADEDDDDDVALVVCFQVS